MTAYRCDDLERRGCSIERNRQRFISIGEVCSGYRIRDLLPGDAQTTAGEYIVGRYGSYLKSDYVQVAHHGSINHPTTLEFYKVSAPSYVFFPGAQSRFNENKNTEENAYLVKLVGISNIYVADGTDKRIKLN
jgi:hypothetical protein